ncbi:inovirus Gp2 family protein [Pseudomonas aeruginosa]|uniref:inovirus Gp2 family protein n=1 Tax=Pseudomonas aeruginosa TaxID=287 RepID=UPI0010688D03|nr:inovirus Gp2 family protein [Pseudomonas aeruginosa]MBX5686457.1 inovirus Gp2 family protein [Pseudomonas aeruginosa]MBX5789882.1 inovirus Gp2 family protein [Pseudomonas aeruginosa]MCT5138550.1 inovirus Gp2 family protein [Pseudomonas aeruginosa]MDP5671151.1 inovirus Gp2 family protein [Pseudomonas aeruginosa]TEH67983.1 inovirus Gp2 family protein [Pseudomonas aeruginosa]
MLRHPKNTNLHIHTDAFFEGLPVMVEKGPFITEYLASLKSTIGLALGQYPRLLAFRVDLRLPLGIDLPDYAYTNQVMSKFIESFKAKIEHNRGKARDQNPYAHECKVRYVWAREVGAGQRPHYHMLILLNRDAFYTVGRLQSKTPNMVSRLQEAWASALGLQVDQVNGLIELPNNAMYRVDCGDAGALAELFRRGSYLCKVATKCFGDGQHGFRGSRG